MLPGCVDVLFLVLLAPCVVCCRRLKLLFWGRGKKKKKKRTVEKGAERVIFIGVRVTPCRRVTALFSVWYHVIRGGISLRLRLPSATGSPLQPKPSTCLPALGLGVTGLTGLTHNLALSFASPSVVHPPGQLTRICGPSYSLES